MTDIGRPPIREAEVRVLRGGDQYTSEAFGGVMRANKPVMGGSAGAGYPSSAIYYWSHSIFADDFEFGLHSHEGFEIITFVLDGANSHYDTAHHRWVALTSGGLQVIQSGRGIAHNERVAKGTRAFQIWFDPDYQAALQRSPAYRDYGADELPVRVDGPVSIRDLIGGASPVHVETAGLRVRRVTVERNGRVDLPLTADAYSIAYVITGGARVAGVSLEGNDAITVAGAASLTIDAVSDLDVFVVSVPAVPTYVPRRR
jgi:redox-sensitive bicupin YhaK (pirin superfamily)